MCLNRFFIDGYKQKKSLIRQYFHFFVVTNIIACSSNFYFFNIEVLFFGYFLGGIGIDIL